MAAWPDVTLDLSLSATTAASKKYPKWKSYASLFEVAAQEVLHNDLPKIRQMKLGIVLLRDKELLKMNREALNHDFYTDILTFEIERKRAVFEAEFYISLDRASENALEYQATLRNELARLVIHGMLHLAGHDDRNAAGKKRMREKERFFLEHLQTEHSIEY